MWSIQSQPVILASHIQTPVGVTAPLLLEQLPANTPGRAAEDGPSKRAIPSGSPGGAPDSWLQLGPAPAVEAVWGVVSERSLTLLLSRSLYLSTK